MVLAAVAALAAVSLIVAVSTRTDREVPALGLCIALLLVLLSVRSPLLPLFGYVVLIPIEDAVNIGGLGTLARYAAILLIVVYGIPRLGRLTIRAIPLAGWGYVAWAVLSAGWAIDPRAAWTEILVLILLFITAIVIAAVVAERPSIVRPLLWAYSVSAAATACLGLISYLRGGGPLGPEDRIAAIQDQNPAYYAAVLLPALVFALYELVNGRRLFLSFGVILVCTAAIVASGTRGAWLAAAVVFVFFLLPRLDPARRAAAAVIVIALLVITIQLPGLSTLVQQRTDIALSSGGSGRTDIWSVGLNIYESAPVTGVGLGNFSIAFTPERVRDVSVAITDPKILMNRAPHNIGISTLGELGLVGLLLLGLFLGPLVIRRGWGSEAAAVQAALASLLVLALFLDILNRKQLWLLIGIACGLAYLARRQRLESAVTAAEGVDAHRARGSPSSVPGPNA